MTKPLPAIRAVCFDLDGLMFNTEHVFYESADVLLQRRGLAMSRGAMNAMLGRRPLESFQGLIDHLGLTEGPIELLAESRVIFHELLDTKLEPMPGLFELLDLIETSGLPKGVATSSPRDYLDDIFGRFDLSPRFPLQLTAESVTHGKPTLRFISGPPNNWALTRARCSSWRTLKPAREPVLPPVRSWSPSLTITRPTTISRWPVTLPAAYTIHSSPGW